MHSFNKDSDWDDISSAAKLRKIRKPLVERRRRERINTSMLELKSLILQAMCKKESDYEKMEKADILEMTVHYLRTLHHARQAHAVTKFRDGFQECASEVRRYLGSTPGVEPSVPMRMDQHLLNRTHPYPDIIKPEVTKLHHACLPMTSPVTCLPGLYGCQETPLSSVAAVPSGNQDDFNYAQQSALSHSIPSSATAAKFRETYIPKFSVPLGETAASASCSSNVRRNLFEHELRPVKNEASGQGERRVGAERNIENRANDNEANNVDSNAWRPWK